MAMFFRNVVSMLFSKKPAESKVEPPKEEAKTESIETVFKIIEDYNRDKDTADKIKFIHGGSSAFLAFIGKKTHFQDSKGNTIEAVIPSALIPTGVLRKKYGVYPISGELGFGAFGFNQSRRTGINYSAISGMLADEYGLSIARGYAFGAKGMVDIASMHGQLTDTIVYMKKYNYISRLKMLVMLSTNLMLMDPGGAELNAKNYLQLLQTEYETFLKAFPKDENIKKYFDKYLPRIEKILNGKTLPFVADWGFRQAILTQYPLVICSTVESEYARSDIPKEQFYRGNVYLDKVGLMLTPAKYVERLKSDLKKLGVKIAVAALPELPKETLSEASFLNVKNVTEFNDKFKKLKLPDDINSENFREILSTAQTLYLETADAGLFELMKFLLTTSSFQPYQEYENYFNQAYGDYQTLARKVAANPDYFEFNEPLRKKFALLENMEYLHALHEITQRKNGSELVDYANIDISAAKQYITNILESCNNSYHRAAMLESMYRVFACDLKQTIKVPDVLLELIALVKKMFSEILLANPKLVTEDSATIKSFSIVQALLEEVTNKNIISIKKPGYKY